MHLQTLLPLIQAFGVTVVHSIWQIALIWIVFKCLEWRWNNHHQRIYWLALGAMLLTLGWSAWTFMEAWARFEPIALTDFSLSTILEAQNISTPAAWTSQEQEISLWIRLQTWIETHAGAIGWAWLFCTLLLWIRLAGGWYLAQRIRYRHVTVVPERFQQLCQEWTQKLQIRSKVQFLESGLISEPLTLGFWKPVVLFPAGMILQLSTAQVEALLLHELAHIRRHDYLINLFQLCLEVCFFYHPLFWLLSREARARREFCCDELVVKHGSDPLLYARTLTDLQSANLHPQTQFVMNATGKSRFTERIFHIAGITPKRSARPNLWIALLLPLAVCLSSWWPADAETMNTENIDFPSYSLAQDSLPPRNTKKQNPAPTATPAPASGVGAVADKLAEQNPDAKRVSINLEPEKQENVAIEVVKMNVLYIGVDNPLRIAAAGVPAEELQVELIGNGSISGSGGEYIATVTTPGQVTVRVSRRTGSETKFVVDQKYRVKRIPDPTPRLDNRFKSSAISLENLQQSKGIGVLLDNFDFDAICEVVGYTATYLKKESDPITYDNKGGDFNQPIEALIKTAQAGDAFFFDDIWIKCPGDTNPRNLGGLAFKIR
ncbi:MAG TPA: M56 family metallopeptidase [Saprospiraceae bacterium]|nr:M56 family metallopeptidase [Saprospiraceae bacterium]